MHGHIKIRFFSYSKNAKLAYICWTHISRGKPLGTLGGFFVIFYLRDNFCDFLFAFLYIKALLKPVFSKWKEVTPNGIKFLPIGIEFFPECGTTSFKVDAFQKRGSTILTDLPFLNVYSFPLNPGRAGSGYALPLQTV